MSASSIPRLQLSRTKNQLAKIDAPNCWRLHRMKENDEFLFYWRLLFIKKRKMFDRSRLIEFIFDSFGESR